MNKKLLSKKDAVLVLYKLKKAYPDAECALVHRDPFELLVCVVLSAQTTDKSVNAISPGLFAAYPDAVSLAKADPAEVEGIIKRIGMYRTKAKNIIELSKRLVADHGGEVPHDFNALTALPGVGRKTANVVLSVAFGEQHIAVDTHVFRVSNRIGLVDEKDVLATEEALMKKLPKDRWTEAHHSLIFHGRNRCDARKPDCANCEIGDICLKLKLKDK